MKGFGSFESLRKEKKLDFQEIFGKERDRGIVGMELWSVCPAMKVV